MNYPAVVVRVADRERDSEELLQCVAERMHDRRAHRGLDVEHVLGGILLRVTRDERERARFTVESCNQFLEGDAKTFVVGRVFLAKVCRDRYDACCHGMTFFSNRRIVECAHRVRL